MIKKLNRATRIAKATLPSLLAITVLSACGGGGSSDGGASSEGPVAKEARVKGFNLTCDRTVAKYSTTVYILEEKDGNASFTSYSGGEDDGGFTLDIDMQDFEGDGDINADYMRFEFTMRDREFGYSDYGTYVYCAKNGSYYPEDITKPFSDNYRALFTSLADTPYEVKFSVKYNGTTLAVSDIVATELLN